MRYREWITASARFGKSRSTLLTAIDTAFERYERLPTGPNVVLLATAIAAWKVGKGGQASTRDAAVDALEDWVVDEHYRRGEFRRPEHGWGPTQNCYRYAMCDQAADDNGQNSVPGGIVSMPVVPGIPNYHAQLIAGVVADGAPQGKVIHPLPQGAIHPLPGNLPGHYLAMMVGNANGFHWLRRDPYQDHWSHKNGGPADPETICLNVQTRRYYAMTNNVVVAMASDATKLNWFSGFQGMSFIAYFHVPIGGMRVTRTHPLVPLAPPLPPVHVPAPPPVLVRRRTF